MQAFQVLITTIREGMNKMANIEKNLVANLDSAIQILENVRYALDLYDIDLDNFCSIYL